MEPFDLIEYQKKAREICDPKALFELWEEVCKLYERKEIGSYELDEMKVVIWPSLTQLAALRRMVNGQPISVQNSKQRRGRRVS